MMTAAWVTVLKYYHLFNTPCKIKVGGINRVCIVYTDVNVSNLAVSQLLYFPSI